MTELIDQFDILWPAFIAGFLVISTHVPLGQEVLKRGIIFFDLAIAQLSSFGVIILSCLGFDSHHTYTTMLLAIAIATCGALALSRFRDAPARVQEALIGTVFVLSATGSILLLANDPHGNERLQESLAGNILWVNPVDLIPVAITYGVVIAALKFKSAAQSRWFYPLFAVTITISTHLIGVYLVFSSLIIPAIASQTSKRPLLAALTIGGLGYSIGLCVSAMWDTPTSATIVWSLATLGLIAHIANNPPKWVARNKSV